MLNDENSILTLLVQNPYKVFCYFNVSPMMIKEFEDINGENSWKNSKPQLKVYEVINGDAIEKETIYVDPLANNWFIDLKKDGIDVFVKFGRVLENGKFVEFLVSNVVTTPKNYQSQDSNLYYIDVSENFKNEYTEESQEFNSSVEKKN